MLLTIMFTLAVIFDLFMVLVTRMRLPVPKIEKNEEEDRKFGLLTCRIGILSAVLSSGILIGLHLQ